jgi:hypothetical protein
MFIAESGTSNDKCSEIYPGKTAFSEIETTNIKNFVETLDPVPILGKYAYVTETVAGDFCKTHFGTEHQDGGEMRRFLANYSVLHFLTDLKNFPAIPYFFCCGKAVANSAHSSSCGFPFISCCSRQRRSEQIWCLSAMARRSGELFKKQDGC